MLKASKPVSAAYSFGVSASVEVTFERLAGCQPVTMSTAEALTNDTRRAGAMAGRLAMGAMNPRERTVSMISGNAPMRLMLLALGSCGGAGGVREDEVVNVN